MRTLLAITSQFKANRQSVVSEYEIRTLGIVVLYPPTIIQFSKELFGTVFSYSFWSRI